jgi:hypothetical protein
VAEDCPDVCTCKWKGGKQVKLRKIYFQYNIYIIR